MKRLTLLFIVAMLAATAVQAQGDELDTFKMAEYPADVPLRIGVRGGLNLANMSYTNTAEAMRRYDHRLQLQGIGSIFVHLGFGKSGFAISPEVGYIGKGVKLNWDDVDYSMLVDYLDLRLPLTYEFRLPSKPALAPYIMVAPNFSLPFGGEINYAADRYTATEDYRYTCSTEITEADISPFDFGLLLGGGVDYLVQTKNFPLILSLEAGWNFGLTNTFAERENLVGDEGIEPENASNILNDFLGAELWREGRYTGGLEVAARVALPLSGWRPKPAPEEPIDVPYMVSIPRPLPPAPPDTVVVQVCVPDTTPQKKLDTVIVNGREYVKKDCYSLSEMYSFITLGIDISDKRICMYNINFDFNSDKLRPESYQPLNEVLMLMKQFPEISIEVYGHTDSIGTEKYNQNLSERRARSAAKYLVEHGIEASRITSIGFGLKLPIDTNETEEGRFHNRRVEFEILNVENIHHTPAKSSDEEGQESNEQTE